MALGGSTCAVLDVEAVAKDLDIREECISTVICYVGGEAPKRYHCYRDPPISLRVIRFPPQLELLDRPLLRALPSVFSLADVTFHGASPQELASRHPLVAAIIRLSTARCGHYKVDVARLAAEMNASLHDIQKDLQVRWGCRV